MKRLEDQLQMDCVMLFTLKYPKLVGLLFMVHNTPRNAIDGIRLKRMGMVRGVADLAFLYNGKSYYLEMKIKTGKQSKEQKEWEQLITSQGFQYVIIRSIDEFLGFISSVVV